MSHCLECNYGPGWAALFSFQTTASADVALQIWRKKGRDEYLLVGQTEYRHLRPGRYRKTLSSKQRIEVEAGDVIGIQFHQFNPIPYDTVATSCDQQEAGLYTDSTPSGVTPGVVYGFQRKAYSASTCRMYSLYAKYETSSEYLLESSRCWRIIVTVIVLFCARNLASIGEKSLSVIHQPRREILQWGREIRQRRREMCSVGEKFGTVEKNSYRRREICLAQERNVQRRSLFCHIIL